MALRHHRPWQAPALDTAMAAQLGPHAAWLPVGAELLFVRGEPDPISTPVLSLIQAIWERDPRRAHATLRARIRTTTVPCPLDRAVVQVAAKKLSQVGPPVTGGDLLSVPGLDLAHQVEAARARSQASTFDPGVHRVDDPMLLEDWLPQDLQGPLPLRDRPLVAALLDPGGGLLLAARNTAGANRTLHAELNLVHAWWRATGSPLPTGSRLLTTLRPCRMCAALVVRAAAGPVAVTWLHDDPGPLAQGTALALLGWEQPYLP